MGRSWVISRCLADDGGLRAALRNMLTVVSPHHSWVDPALHGEKNRGGFLVVYISAE